MKNNNNGNKTKKSIEPYITYSTYNKDKNVQKKWQSNILNLTTKENKENHNNKEKKDKLKIKNKFIIDNSLIINKENNKKPYIKRYYNTTLNSQTNSTKNISNKSKHLVLNSSELLLNKIKNKNIASKKIKHNKNNSMKEIKPIQNKSKVFKINKPKSNNENSSVLKENKIIKIKKIQNQKNINNLNKDIINNYYGPVDIGLISFKNMEETIDDIINKMDKKGFEYKKINNNMIRFSKNGRIIDIEIVKIKKNFLYYLTKKIH